MRGKTEVSRRGNAFVIGDAAGLATRDRCKGIGPAVRSGLLAAHTICSGAKFDLDQVDAHTLGPRLVHRALDFAFTGNR